DVVRTEAAETLGEPRDGRIVRHLERASVGFRMYAIWVAITDRPVSVITIENRRKMAPRAVGEMTIRPARWAMPWAKNTPTARARKLIRRAVTWIARKSPRGNAPMRKKPPKNPTKRIVDSMAETIRLEA